MATDRPSTQRAKYLVLAAVLIVGGILAIILRGGTGWSGWDLTKTLGSALAILLGLGFLKKSADA